MARVSLFRHFIPIARENQGRNSISVNHTANCTCVHTLDASGASSKTKFWKGHGATSFSTCRIKIVTRGKKKEKHRFYYSTREKSGTLRVHVCTCVLCSRGFRISYLDIERVSFPPRTIAAVTEEDKKEKGSRVRSGWERVRIPAPPPSLLPPQVHLVHLRDGGGIIRPERCIMHARGTARGIQVKETSPWKRPWPPSINTRDGVSVRSFVRSFVRSAGRSLTQAKSPRGPIGHVRERSSLYPSTSPPCPPAPAPPTPPPSSLSLTWRSRYNSSPPSQARMVFSFDVFPFADVLAFGVTDANRDERDVPCQLSRYVGTCESHVERKGRGKDSPFRIYFGSLSNQTRVKRII